MDTAGAGTAAEAGAAAGAEESAISPATRRAIERANAGLATRAVAEMDRRLSWFRTLPAQQRSWVTLVAQAGITGYLHWVENPAADLRLADQVFARAPRDLIRSVSLRRTVELVRVAITVAEQQLPELGASAAERRMLRESLLRYSREIAFAAAAVYASAAETRGAWDARVEAAVIDGIVRGEDVQALVSRAATLNWDPGATSRIVVGGAPLVDREQAVDAVAAFARRIGVSAMAAVHGGTLVAIFASDAVPDPAVADLFGDGPVVYSPARTGLAAAPASAADALSGFRVAHAWATAPRPVSASELLPERVLSGDEHAANLLIRDVFLPLTTASSPLLSTVDAYLAHGGALEPAARSVFIHPNTMRYRLRKVAETTGRDPWSPRDMLALNVALIVGRLAGGRSTTAAGDMADPT